VSVSRPDLTEGLSNFLADKWGGPVKVTNLSASTTGARRANISFDATPDGEHEPKRLVATIMPTAAIQINRMGAEAEVRILARDGGVPVPEVIGWSEDESWVGGPFFLSERVDGETVPRAVLRLVEERRIGEQVAAQLGDALARLHAIDPSRAPAGLIDPPPGDPAGSALKGIEAIVDGLLEPRPAVTFGMRWLRRNLPSAPGVETIVHTDVRTGNIIVGPDGLRAVLDWEGTRRHGDPMEDLAWVSLRMWRFRNDDKEVGGFAGLEPFVTAYEAAGGTFDADRYRWWKACGTLKWALGLAGQAAGHLDGSFRSIVMAASGRRVPEMEWDLLMLTKP
jgi:aminoglycoside phosphotransferase (APT) family kinase protein